MVPLMPEDKMRLEMLVKRSKHQHKLPFKRLRNASQSENSTKDRFHPGEKIYVFDNYVNQFCLTIQQSLVATGNWFPEPLRYKILRCSKPLHNTAKYLLINYAHPPLRYNLNLISITYNT